MDITRELRNLVSTGDVHFGFNQAMRATQDKKAKLIIVSNNCKRENLEKIKDTDAVRTYEFEGNNFDLGQACGKPFAISILTILDEGDSSVLDLI